MRRIEAYMWRCDDDCQCSQPVIELITDNPADHRTVIRKLLWSGEFTSEGQQTKEQWLSLHEEAKKYNCDYIEPIPKDFL